MPTFNIDLKAKMKKIIITFLLCATAQKQTHSFSLVQNKPLSLLTSTPTLLLRNRFELIPNSTTASRHHKRRNYQTTTHLLLLYLNNQIRLSSSSASSSTTKLYDLSEWRDLMFDIPPDLQQEQEKNFDDAPIREICILPFPIEDVLVQGETKELCLYEDRFHQLFTKSQQSHQNVLAMGILAPPSGMLQTVTLCDIDSYRVMPGQTELGTSYSILVTIRAVSRAVLLDIRHDDNIPFLYGYCREIFDTSSSSSSSTTTTTSDNSSSPSELIVDQGNELVYRIEQVFESLIALEDTLKMMGGMEDEDGDGFDEGVSDASMRRRILEAQLDEEFLQDDAENDEVVEEEDEDDDDDDEYIDRRKRFQQAFKIAKATDMQGYRIQTNFQNNKKSIQELTALSWAYLCTEVDSLEILAYRLRAVQSSDLLERLRICLMMLMERRSKVKSILKSIKDDK